MLDLGHTIPLSLYIHFPWCISKCPYCDFNSHAMGGASVDDFAYVDAITADLEMELPRIWGRKINSVFIGGGTPSLLSAESIKRLMTVLRSHVGLRSDTEVTLEANPGAADAGRFSAYRAAGVNRLSIGVQSFDDEKLRVLGRIHDSKEAGSAIEAARKAGFDNINIDLMFALPGQKLPEVTRDLERAIVYQPEHISWYQLTIEPNTVFHSRPPDTPDDEACWEFKETGRKLLRDHGYIQYEVSAYSQRHRRCAHNLNYWTFGDYLGIGAGAHSKLTDPAMGKIHRYARHRLPGKYMELAGTPACVVDSSTIGRKDLPLEFMMNALRLMDGIPANLFYETTGLPLSVIREPLQKSEERELLQWTVTELKPTEKGQRYLNDLLQLFM